MIPIADRNQRDRIMVVVDIGAGRLVPHFSLKQWHRIGQNNRNSYSLSRKDRKDCSKFGIINVLSIHEAWALNWIRGVHRILQNFSLDSFIQNTCNVYAAKMLETTILLYICSLCPVPTNMRSTHTHMHTHHPKLGYIDSDFLWAECAHTAYNISFFVFNFLHTLTKDTPHIHRQRWRRCVSHFSPFLRSEISFQYGHMVERMLLNI